jgi:hypothetical protein
VTNAEVQKLMQEKSEKEKSLNLFQRINKVMLEVTTVIKDAEISMGQGRGYTGVSHDAVTKALHLPLAKAGLVLKVTTKDCVKSEFENVKVWNGQETKSKVYRADLRVILTLVNADAPNDREDFEFEATAFDTGDKAIGKALSMAVKNGLLKIFMLESLDKEEERVTEESTYRQAPPPQQRQNMQQKPHNYAPGAVNK